MRRITIGIMTALMLAACGGSSDGPAPLKGDYPSAGPEFANAGTGIGVVLETDLGNIHIEVYPERAPKTSKEFLYYVEKGLYDGQGFYRVVTPQNDNRNMDLSIVQGGRLDLVDLTLVEHETTQQTGLQNVTGSLALAREGIGTGSGAFFFINLDNNNILDHGGARNPDGQGFAVFGRITKGLEIAYWIQQQKTYEKGEAVDQPPAFAQMDDQLLVKPVFIKKAYRKN